MTASSSEHATVGTTYVQVRMVVEGSSGPEYVHVELSLAEDAPSAVSIDFLAAQLLGICAPRDQLPDVTAAGGAVEQSHCLLASPSLVIAAGVAIEPGSALAQVQEWLESGQGAQMLEKARQANAAAKPAS